MFGAQLIMAMSQLQNPDFVIKNWYTALLGILLVTIATVFNTWGAKKLALAESVFVSLHIACFFIVLITVAVTSPKNDAKEVFLTFTDNGGSYPLSTYHMLCLSESFRANRALSVGLAVMVGQVPAMWNVLASDAVAHLCKSLYVPCKAQTQPLIERKAEEVKDASTVTPQTMFYSYLLNIPLAFAMLLVFLFAMTDVATATTEAFPFVWVLQNSLSTAGATAITALMFILVFMITISCYASTSRQTFAFARDDGLPFSTWMKKVLWWPVSTESQNTDGWHRSTPN
jgi:choline transport protein